MKVEKLLWEGHWERTEPFYGVSQPQLVLFFGSSDKLQAPSHYQELRDRFPSAHIVGCSTAGEILDDEVFDDSVVATAIEFDQVEVAV
ncbi:MAG: FIST N-terminal domain-containing protein, partial [Acidobacteriota bacterium]